jgi:hypothetical protein
MCLHLSETTKKAKELTEVEQGKLFSILYYWSGFIFISLLGALVVILIPFVVRSLFGVVVFCFGFALVIMLVVGMFRASKIES